MRIYRYRARIRPTILFLVTFVAQQATSQLAASDSDPRPNVILIMADDMGYECLGCYGSASYETPHLDRLAREGLRFEHCYSQPICTPSRVKIMTGKYNFRNYEEFGYLNPKERTFGQLMQQAGYRTCIAGKWQLNGIHHDLPNGQDRSRPHKSGFHESCLWQVTRDKKVGERYADPLIEENGKDLAGLEDRYGPDVFVDFVCDFIERNRERPFLVYYPMVLTHDPWVPTPDSREWANGDRHKEEKRFFTDMVAYCDKAVGRIDAKLAELGLREKTVLLFTADNGTVGGLTSKMRDGSLVHGGKGTPTDAGTRVPFIASWPGTAPQGKVLSDLIDFSDFYVTLGEIAGTKLSPGEHDGRSFLPQLRGEQGEPREYMFCHFEPSWRSPVNRTVRFARNQRYKLYHDGRLFDVATDVLEETALDPGNAEADAARRRLQSVLDSMPAAQPRPPKAVNKQTF